MTTGQKLRTKRQQLGLSQAKLAELSGVSQYVLSAYELHKAELSPADLAAVSSALSNTSRVEDVARRRKRYQAHTYQVVSHDAARVKLAIPTAGNTLYREAIEQLAEDHSRPKEDRLSAVSLFSGCGGFSLGFSAAGFAVRGFLEIDDGLRAIYRQNFPKSLELGGDITHLSDAELACLNEKIGTVRAIIGGPPCQGFSLSGKRDVSDPRNALFRHYLRVVDVLRPEIAVLENVRLLTSMKSPSGSLVRDDICQEFLSHGYNVKCFEVNAKYFGVPQRRERVLFVAIRTDLNQAPSLPDFTHSDVRDDLFLKTEPLRTFGDAVSDLPYLESGESSDDPLHQAVRHPQHVIDWLWDVPEGRSAHDNESPDKRPPSGYNTTYKRQVWGEPASTVQTTFGMISGCRNVHPIATRSLTMREAARIQSFPDSYQFQGNAGVIRTGIGNAVPPLLAYRVALYARDIIRSCRNTVLQD